MSEKTWEQHLALPIDEAYLVFVDLETTGLNPLIGDRVCEVAMVCFRGNDEVDSFVSLINPERTISPGAMAINGITSAMVRDAPRFGEVAGEVDRLLRLGVPVAHNAPFDLAFLAVELRLAGYESAMMPALDTLAIARRAFSFKSNSLGNIAIQLGIDTPAHRALSDVLVTRAIFQRFVQKLAGKNRLCSIADILEVQGGGIGWPTLHMGEAVTLPPAIGEAIGSGLRLRLNYRSANGILTERLVDPLQVVSRGRANYLLAFCHLRQEQRTFRIDRIEDWQRA